MPGTSQDPGLQAAAEPLPPGPSPADVDYRHRRHKRNARSRVKDPGGVRLRWELSALLVGVAIWEIIGRTKPHVLPSVDHVWSAGVGLSQHGGLWAQIGVTLRDLLIGFAIAMVVGSVLAVLMGLSKVVARVANMYLYWLLAVPEIALIPFIVVAIGYSTKARFAVILIFSLPVITQRIMEGVLNVPSQLLYMSHSFEAGTWRRITRVILPAALPSVMVAARLGFARSLLGVVSAGIFMEEFGLGGQLFLYQQRFALPEMFVFLLAVIIVGVVGTRVIQWLDKRVTSWNVGAAAV